MIPLTILLFEYSVKQYLCKAFPSFRLHRLLELEEALKVYCSDALRCRISYIFACRLTWKIQYRMLVARSHAATEADWLCRSIFDTSTLIKRFCKFLRCRYCKDFESWNCCLWHALVVPNYECRAQAVANKCAKSSIGFWHDAGVVSALSLYRQRNGWEYLAFPYLPRWYNVDYHRRYVAIADKSDAEGVQIKDKTAQRKRKILSVAESGASDCI